jgi:hypothetical protein
MVSNVMGTESRNPGFYSQPRPELVPPAPTPSADESEIALSTVRHFSIVLGGPLYNFLQRHGILGVGFRNVFTRVVVLIALTWLPLLLFSLRDGLAFGQRVRIPLLYGFAVNGKFLIGLPLLLLADLVIDPAVRRALAEFVNERLVPNQELPEFTTILIKVRRWRDSWIPEAILFLLAFFPLFFFYHEWRGDAVSSWHTRNGGLTAAGWWFAAISAPVFRFIVYRWGFRYFLWGALLWRINRLNLSLIPTHPDHAAGLNFLGLAQRRFGILLCAVGCGFAGHLANMIAFEGASVGSQKFVIAGFIVMLVIVGLLPLLLLAPKLAKVRRTGLLEYGRLANSYTTSFHRKWVSNIEAPTEPLLGTGDIQSLADMGNSFAFVEKMSVVPITKRLVLQLAVQAALPLIPVIILGTPTAELIRAVIKMLV